MGVGQEIFNPQTLQFLNQNGPKWQKIDRDESVMAITSKVKVNSSCFGEKYWLVRVLYSKYDLLL